MIQISHSHKIHRPTMTNGNSSDISTCICNSIPRFLNSLYNFALQLPIVRHFLHSFVQHSAQLHLIPRFSGSAEKRRRDVAIVHTQEAYTGGMFLQLIVRSASAQLPFDPQTTSSSEKRHSDTNCATSLAFCHPFCVDISPAPLPDRRRMKHMKAAFHGRFE